MRMSMKQRGGTVLAIVAMAGMAAGCGVVYKPQEFSKSSFTYGYKGDFEAEIDLVPLTFYSARAANADGYTPRTLPAAFATLDPDARPSIRSRLAAAGLDRVEPAIAMEPPLEFPPYDPARELLPVAQTKDDLAPLPAFDLSAGSVDSLLSASAPLDALPETGTSPVRPVDPLVVRREALDNPLPDVPARPYRIGPGDVLSLQSQARILPSLEGGSGTDEMAGAQSLLVQDDGKIFIPIVGPVTIAGLTLPEARMRISERLSESQIGVDPGIQVVEFGAQQVAVSGIGGVNQLLPITVNPLTLGEAVILSGGFGVNPDNTIVRVLRDGEIYEMTGDQVAGSGALTDRILLDGDIVSVKPAYNLELALTYFEQQMRMRALEREGLADTLTRRAEDRTAEATDRTITLFNVQLENYRIQAERLRQEAAIGRLTSQRQTDQLNENARLSNIVARQAYLDKLRGLEELNRQALRVLRNDRRAVDVTNQAERLRVRAERRALLEYENRDLEMDVAANQRAQALFRERMTLGAVEQDYVTVAGETLRQTTVKLPFESRMTLNRVLYEQPNGVNPTTGDTSEIYVFRVPKGREDENRLVVFHLDASNPAALTAASVFEMRPNDVVYVNPQPITTWNRVLSQIIPSTGLLQSAVNNLR